MSKFRDSIVGSIIILAAICLVVTFGLSATNAFTKDIIEANEGAASFGLFEELLPGAKFEAVDAELPEGVSQAVLADTGDYGFVVTTSGYGGDVTYVITVDSTGAYSGILMGANTETPGIGSRVDDPEFLGSFIGKTEPGTDAVTGATVTSNSLKAALAKASEAFIAVS